MLKSQRRDYSDMNFQNQLKKYLRHSNTDSHVHSSSIYSAHNGSGTVRERRDYRDHKMKTLKPKIPTTHLSESQE